MLLVLFSLEGDDEVNVFIMLLVYVFISCSLHYKCKLLSQYVLFFVFFAF